jgi:hypothetical protein
VFHLPEILNTYNFTSPYYLIIGWAFGSWNIKQTTFINTPAWSCSIKYFRSVETFTYMEMSQLFVKVLKIYSPTFGALWPSFFSISYAIQDFMLCCVIWRTTIFSHHLRQTRGHCCLIQLRTCEKSVTLSIARYISKNNLLAYLLQESQGTGVNIESWRHVETFIDCCTRTPITAIQFKMV